MIGVFLFLFPSVAYFMGVWVGQSNANNWKKRAKETLALCDKMMDTLEDMKIVTEHYKNKYEAMVSEKTVQPAQLIK